MKVEFRDTKLLNVSPLIANYSYGVQRVNKTTQMFGAEISLNSDVLIDNAMVCFKTCYLSYEILIRLSI